MMKKQVCVWLVVGDSKLLILEGCAFELNQPCF